MSATVAGEVREARERARAAHRGGLGGVELARTLAAAMDETLIPLFEEAAAGGMALIALGGYARGELCPHSDLDLMVLHSGLRDAGARAQRVFYPLWDAGLTVGHAVRTPKECLRLARESLEAETSFLGTRLIAGDAALHAGFQEAALKQSRKHGARFLAGVHEMMRARHAAHGTATSQLEPNLKEGTGGLRDLHVLTWLEAVFPGSTTHDPSGAARLAEANEMLLRVRNELHYRSERAYDVLLFEHQRPIAQLLCYLDGERAAEDAFMRDLFAHTRSVEHTVSGVMADLTSSSGAPVVFDLERDPSAALAAFTGPQPGARTTAALTEALRPLTALPWTPQVRRAFIALLRTGDAAALEAADHAGVMGRLLHGWDAVRCQPQHNVYHRFTVDAHLYEAVAAAARMLVGDADQVVADAVAGLPDHEVLLLAALLHDAGKGTDEDHAERGERMAREILGVMRMDEARTDLICWLVRHHLLMVEAAMRRDLNDESVIVETAVRIGDADRARLLFLLSVADGRATSESAWSPWKAALVAELFTKVLRVIERRDVATPDAVDLARVRAAELRRGLAHHDLEQVEQHISDMGRAYLLTFDPESLIRHYALMSRVPPGGVSAAVVPAGEPGVATYTVAAHDRPGLFATVSGVLALNGVNILTAQGFSRADGIAIEVFRCQATDLGRFAKVDADLDRALRGRLALDARLAERRAAYERAPKARRREPEVIIDNSGDFATVVEVHARDRVGLLFDITRAMADLSLDITLAKIATYGEDVVDVFYLRDADGQKVTDPAHVEELRRAVLFRLESDPILGPG